MVEEKRKAKKRLLPRKGSLCFWRANTEAGYENLIRMGMLNCVVQRSVGHHSETTLAHYLWLINKTLALLSVKRPSGHRSLFELMQTFGGDLGLRHLK